MTELLFTPAFAPFTLALGLLFGLLGLEIAALLLGGSLLGMEAEADTDTGILDADGGPEPDSFAEAPPHNDSDGTGTDLFGIGKVPLMIWLAAMLLAFGAGGMVIQSGAQSLLGRPLPGWLAMVPAGILGLGFARGFAGRFARLLPRVETSAMSENRLGRTQGIVSQGTAARGRPAEIRVRDRHGNTHYLRAEPLRDTDEIPQGTAVLVLRKSRDQGYRLVALDD